MTVLFELGHIVATPGALEVLGEGVFFSDLIHRHHSGDWGELDEEDQEQNRLALREGMRLFSSYKIGKNTLWIITEADRSSTTILKPEEY